jgi:cobalt-zinc-cadmium efflux system protein
MEGAPVEISLEEVYTKLNEISLIENAHHLHMWAVGEKDIFFEGHIKTGDITLSETRPIYDKIKHILEHYGVNHITLQFESEECCPNDMLCAGIGK